VISDKQLDAALEYLRESIDVASKARSDKVVTEQWIKTTRARLMVQALKDGVASVAAQTVTAEAHPDFKQAVEAYGAAVQLDAFHQMKRETASAWLEAWRTQSSNERAQGKIG
jgi:c-di-AMP phosphodiesterase-like protein